MSSIKIVILSEGKCLSEGPLQPLMFDAASGNSLEKRHLSHPRCSNLPSAVFVMSL